MAESPLLRIDVDQQVDYAVLILAGELDMSGAPSLGERVSQLRDAGTTRLVLDVSGLSFCDSSGLTRFVVDSAACTAAGGWLRLAAPREQLVRVLTIAELLTVLPAYRTLPAAIKGHALDRIT